MTSVDYPRLCAYLTLLAATILFWFLLLNGILT